MKSIQELILILIPELELSIPVDSRINTGIKVFWTSLDYARYLHEMLFANYTLCHLKHHIDGCQHNVFVLDMVFKFICELINNPPAAYLLENWVSLHLKISLLKKQLGGVSRSFREKILYASVREKYSTATEMLLTVGV